MVGRLTAVCFRPDSATAPLNESEGNRTPAHSVKSRVLYLAELQIHIRGSYGIRTRD